MNKILLIIKREYLSRVRKKSFLLMTFLVPTLIIGMYALIAFLAYRGGDSITRVAVYDESSLFAGRLTDSRTLDFETAHGTLAEEKQKANSGGGFLLFIPENVAQTQKVELFSEKKAPIFVMGDIEDQVNSILREKLLSDAGIDPKVLDQIKPDVTVSAKELTAEGGEKDSSAGAAYGAGFAAAILIYMSLFIYGAQVMRGVIEEKTNRVIEVIVSSVRPFQLMMGKIIGIGLVGLTQYLLWITLSAGLTTVAAQAIGGDEPAKAKTEQLDQPRAPSPASGPGAQVLNAMQTINFPYILSFFVIYFLGGYMLYSALFAAVGSAVDNETETQQFMLPITLPLLFTYILSFAFIINNPDSSLSFWLSMIPFTSPIAMMVRLPFGVPGWELALSVSLLLGGFILTTWVAARIYRVGILMYGKKINYRELAKWFMYKD